MSELVGESPWLKKILLRRGRAAVVVSDTAAATPVPAKDAGCLLLVLSGLVTASRVVVLPDVDGADWIVRNETTGGFDVAIKGPTGSGVSVGPGASAHVVRSGGNMRLASGDGGVVLVAMTDTSSTTLSAEQASARVLVLVGHFDAMSGDETSLVLPRDGRDRVVLNRTTGSVQMYIRDQSVGGTGPRVSEGGSAHVINYGNDFFPVDRVEAADATISLAEDGKISATGTFGTGTLTAGAVVLGDYFTARSGLLKALVSGSTSATGLQSLVSAGVYFAENNAALDLVVRIVGRKSSGSGTIVGTLNGAYELNGGTLTLLGSVDKTIKTNTAATVANLALAISDKLVNVQVNPPDAGPWRWTVSYELTVRNQAA